MRVSGIFLCVLLFCGVFGLGTGRGEALGLELLAAGESAVQLALSLAGAYMIWGGLLKILERAGAVHALAQGLARPVRWLLGEEGRRPEVREAVCVNFTANLLGLGNAATPAGLRAMQYMAEGAKKDRPTAGMCMFLLVNASSLQLVPTTVLSLRAAAGAANPGDILLPALIGSAASTVCAVCLGKLCERLWPA